MDRPDGEKQGAVPHLAGFRADLGGFYVNKALVLQLANLLGYGVSTHSCVLTYASDAGPALVGLPVLTENQVGVERHLPWGKAQGEDLIGQKKKSALLQPFRVSVFDFRGATSPIVFQNSTPMFRPMSIAFSDFTLRSQAYSFKHTANPVWRSSFLCLHHRKF